MPQHLPLCFRDLADMVLTGLQRDISAHLVSGGNVAACGTAITARHVCLPFPR